MALICYLACSQKVLRDAMATSMFRFPAVETYGSLCLIRSGRRDTGERRQVVILCALEL